MKKYALHASDALQRCFTPKGGTKELNFPNEKHLKITGEPEIIHPNQTGRKQTEFKGVREVNGEYRTHVYCIFPGNEIREKHLEIFSNASKAAAELRRFVIGNKQFTIHGQGWGQPIVVPFNQLQTINSNQGVPNAFGPGEYLLIKEVQAKSEATLDSEIVCELKKGDRITIKSTQLLAEDPSQRLRGQLSYGGWITLKKKELTFVTPCIAQQNQKGAKRKFDASLVTGAAPPRKRQRVFHSRYHGVTPWNGAWRGFVYLLDPRTHSVTERHVGTFDTEQQAADSVRNYAATIKLSEKFGGPHIYGAKWGEPKATASSTDNPKRSMFKHVYWNKGCNKWIVQQRNREGKRQHVGVYLDEYQAAQAADQWLLQCYRGEEDLLDVSRLNFPQNALKLLKTRPKHKKEDIQIPKSVEGNFMTIVFEDSPFGFTITRGQDGLNAKVDTVLPSANAKGVQKDLIIRNINGWNAIGEKFEAVSAQLNRATLPCAIQFVRQVLLNSTLPAFLPVNSNINSVQSPVASPENPQPNSPRSRPPKKRHFVRQPKPMSPKSPPTAPVFKVGERVCINGWQKLAEINESYASMEPKGTVTKIFSRSFRYEYKITLANEDTLTLAEERLEKDDPALRDIERNLVDTNESIKNARERLLREEGQLHNLDRQISNVNNSLIQLDFRIESLRSERKKLLSRKQHYQSERQKSQTQKDILESTIKEHNGRLKTLQQSILSRAQTNVKVETSVEAPPTTNNASMKHAKVEEQSL